MVKPKSLLRKLAQARKGAPLVFRQIRQWQLVRWKGVPTARYLTAPQKQPPSKTGSFATGMSGRLARRSAEGRRLTRPLRRVKRRLPVPQSVSRYLKDTFTRAR